MTVRAKFILICGLAAVLAGGVMFRATGKGVGVSPDSVQYFHYARVLLHREAAASEDGLSIAVTHYPPLYPFMLAVFNGLGATLITAAGNVNVVCFTATAALAAGIVLRNGGMIRAIIAVMLIAAQPALMNIHLWALSEPPFMVLLLIVNGLLAEYRAGRWSSRPLAIAIGAALGAAVLTRYVGLALIPPAIWIVWRTPGRPTRRRDAFLLALTAATPIAIMAVIQRAMGGSVGHRSIEYHHISAARFEELLTTFQSWLIAPGHFVDYASLAAVMVIAITITLLAWKSRRSGLAPMAVLMCSCYIAFLLVSIALFDNATPLDDRMLSPVALLLTIWLACDLPAFWSWQKRSLQWPGFVAVGLAVLIVVGGAPRVAESITTLRASGLGFNHIKFKKSQLVEACRKLPKNAVIYSNFPEAIWLQAGRDARILPGHPTELGRADTPLADQMALVCKRLGDGGYIAYFNFHKGRRPTNVILSVDELGADLMLKVAKRATDGTLYRASGRTPATMIAPPATQAAN